MDMPIIIKPLESGNASQSLFPLRRFLLPVEPLTIAVYVVLVARMVEELRSVLTGQRLVLAFIIDQKELRNGLNSKYVQEIIRIGKIEDRHHLETKNSGFVEAWRRYASEA